MAEQYITCPHCGKRIQLSKALTQQIQADLRKTFDSEAKAREKQAAAYFEKRLSVATTRAEKHAQLEFTKRLATEQTRLAKQTRATLEHEFSTQVTDLQKQLRDKEKDAAALKQQQLDLEILKTQLANRQKTIDTEIDRKVQKALEKAESETAKRIEQEHRTRELQLEKKLSDAKKQATDLKIRLEQSSQQSQGEVAEETLEDHLRKAFPEDKIEPIAKGQKGADVLQRVYSPGGQFCGTIIWESKNTRAWSKAWLPKLRADQRRAKAELAVLVSKAFPKDVSHFAQVDGIWVTEDSLVFGVASALRANITQAALTKQSSKGAHGKMQMLYEYLSSLEFKQRIEGMVEAFHSMQEDLARERQTTEKNWAKREKQIQLVVLNVSGMYGDMQGIAGQSLPKIRRLELPAPAEP